MSKVDYSGLYGAADRAGMEAVSKLTVEPMVVEGYGKRYFVEDGVCGFAWVTVKPANSAFAKWLKERALARNAYGGGVSIWVSKFNQSMQKKEAYANAFARVLRDNDINAYSESRMD